MSKHRSDYEAMAEAFKALGHPVRLLIFEAVRRSCCLAEGASADLCGYHVGDIYEAVDVAPSTVSHHLKELKRAGLVVERRAGKFVYLTLGHERLGELVGFAVGETIRPRHDPAPPRRKR